MITSFQSDDSEHLRLLADWFDQQQGLEWSDKGFEIQNDLRRIADTIEEQSLKQTDSARS